MGLNRFNIPDDNGFFFDPKKKLSTGSIDRPPSGYSAYIIVFFVYLRCLRV